VVLTIGGKQFKSEMAKSKAGELLFTEGMEIEKSDEVGEGRVEVFAYDAREEKSELLGAGAVNLEGAERKVVVKNEKGVETGEVFIDYKVVAKEAFAVSKELTQIIQKGALLNRSSIDHMNNYSASRTLSQSQHYGGESVARRKERVSVVNHNHNVFIPSEKRFMSYQDKQNHIVSYLREKDQFDFKDGHAKVYYKGAAIGVGEKSDFTNQFRSNPGVGAYHLPSIWDRY
jgi:hypothetical protein